MAAAGASTPWRRWLSGLLMATTCVLGLSACSTTGRNFDSSALSLFVPGQTTLAQASSLLGSDPVNIYGRLDGSATARWGHKASLLTDAIYFNQELWLAFGPDGRFERVVESKNIPRAYQSRPQPMLPQTSAALAPRAATSANDASVQHEPAVTYGLSSHY